MSTIKVNTPCLLVLFANNEMSIAPTAKGWTLEFCWIVKQVSRYDGRWGEAVILEELNKFELKLARLDTTLPLVLTSPADLVHE